MMDIIYMWAECTILAVGGEDASYGLNGISTERHAQPKLRLGEWQLTSVQHSVAAP